MQQLTVRTEPCIQAVLPTRILFHATQRAMKGTLLALYNYNNTQPGLLAASTTQAPVRWLENDRPNSTRLKPKSRPAHRAHPPKPCVVEKQW